MIGRIIRAMKPLKFFFFIFVVFFMDLYVIELTHNLLLDTVILGFQFMLLFVMWIVILNEHS